MLYTGIDCTYLCFGISMIAGCRGIGMDGEYRQQLLLGGHPSQCEQACLAHHYCRSDLCVHVVLHAWDGMCWQGMRQCQQYLLM